jgi:hypothetical protein
VIDLIAQMRSCVETVWRDELTKAGFDDATLETLAPSFANQ